MNSGGDSQATTTAYVVLGLVEARKALTHVLELDPAHILAWEELRKL